MMWRRTSLCLALLGWTVPRRLQDWRGIAVVR